MQSINFKFMKSKINIIAEIGVNHNGSVDNAIKLIKAAKKCGANTVKFQTFFADQMVKKNTKKVIYQKKSTSKKLSHYQMIKNLELSKKNFKKIIAFCKKIKIKFLSTPYDLKSVELLEKLNIKEYKVASTDLVDMILHERLIRTKKPIILSTGASNLSEIKNTVNFYKKKKYKKLSLLHCVSNYPCSKKSLNLNVIKTLKKTFKLPIGFSDHSEGPAAAQLAVALGATIIEKHFTLNNKSTGPDHKASDNPKNFLNYVTHLRNAEIIIGSGVKRIQKEEKNIRKISRKSITLKKDVLKNQILRMKDIIMKRPGIGLIGQELKKVIGKKFKKNLKKDYQIKYKDMYL